MSRLYASIVTYHCDIPKLKQAIESLFVQEVPCQLHLVDNHSSADYQAELHGVLKSFDESVQQKFALSCAAENRGFGYGHNIAFSHIPDDADYWLVMNPDVVVQNGCLRTMLDFMELHPDVGCCVPRVAFPDGSLQYLNKRLPSVFDLFVRRFLPSFLKNSAWVKRKMDAYEMRDVGYEEVVDVPFASGCFMLLRRSIIEDIGGFDERFFMYLEDCDLSRRITQVAKVQYVPDACIAHHWARGSHKSFKLFVVMLQSMRHYFSKWGWKWL